MRIRLRRSEIRNDTIPYSFYGSNSSSNSNEEFPDIPTEEEEELGDIPIDDAEELPDIPVEDIPVEEIKIPDIPV